MDGWDFTGPPDLTFHNNIADPETADCATGCHNGAIAPATVAGFHNGLLTERSGVIWDGADTSVTEGDKIAWTITDVVDDGTDLTITWQADYDGVGVDPCNATAGPGAPVFFADGNGNLSILRNYAQGEDFILGTRDDRAGQPGSTPAVDDTNTTCAGNVATTVVPVEATDAMYGRVAIQGKPRLPSPDPADADGLMQVRAFTPTYDWVVGVGGAAPERRAVADSGLCLDCHVGSMYQHGGNRVDNIDMCYLCHNTAANDEYVRVDSYGVDPSEAYDGRAGQNFGMKEMVHAVHPAGATGNPIVIYRGRGIYGWATDESQLANWPGSGDDLPVFGSDDGAGNPVLQNHIFHAPTYPRALNDCAACHVATVELFPDATKAMASTVEAGEPPFGDQLNDVLEGVQTSSCVTCHADSASKAHAYQNSWTPQEFEEGRQTIIDAN
jgi:OmcA/MtrC family decaheme c-type cytochrome